MIALAADTLVGQEPSAIGLFEAIVLGLVEGLTEFLPISSTGHLIVAQRLLGMQASEANNVFAIGIQLGAISAILVLYWKRLWAATRTVLQPDPARPNLLLQIFVAAVPAVVLGLLFDDLIDEHLFSSRVVAGTVLVGGVLLLWLERFLRARGRGGGEVATMSYRTALGIGLWQCLALVPGTSRAAATIAGALLLGLSRTAAAEFSFLVGLPILYGAALYKLLGYRAMLHGELLTAFVVGSVVAFLSALAVVVPFVAYLRRHDFRPFAWYRIVAGLVLVWLCWRGLLAD